MQGKHSLGVLVALAALGVSAPAWADEPATARSLQLGLGFRYGAELNEGDSNPWGTGLGFEVGYTFPSALYLGGNFEYFFGNSVELAGAEVSSHLWQLTGEAGYDVGLGDSFVIRPKAGLGVASVTGKACLDGFGCSSDSESHFAFAPGATFILMTRSFSLSLDARYELVFAGDTTPKALILSAGVGF